LLYEFNEVLVLISCVTTQLEPVHAEMNVSRTKAGSLVAVNKWMILDEAFGDRVFVVAGLWSKDGRFREAW
jgi:hypothetical protein